MASHVVGAPDTAREHTAARKGSASTTEPDPGSASMASHVGGEIDTTRKRQSALRGSSSTIEPNTGSASTAGHTIGSQRRSKTGQGPPASMADTFPPRPRDPTKYSVPTRHDAHGAVTATGLHPRDNSTAAFHADAALARRARLKFEAAAPDRKPSAAELVRSRVAIAPVGKRQPSPWAAPTSPKRDQPTSATRRATSDSIEASKGADPRLWRF